MKIETLLDEIDLGRLALPEFQRGYVWNREQVRGLMQSLYRDYPIGSLLVWITGADDAATRGDQELAPGSVELLLDGQQRITSLYGIIRGKAPKFFEGKARAFLDLYFHLDEETFEFHAPLKMKGDPRWISVTRIMQEGAGKSIQAVLASPELAENVGMYLNRLNAIDQIKKRDLHIHKIAGVDKTIDVVVDIFNRVNSGGTKLSKGDLALARICGHWPQARDEMNGRLSKWAKAGFNKFTLDWLLRNVNTVVQGEARFGKMADISVDSFKKGLVDSERAVDYLLNLISARLGLEHTRVLGSRNAFPVMARYVALRGGKLASAAEQDKLLYWYVHTMAWGRFAGSVESTLDQDLKVLDDDPASLDRLVDTLRASRGDLRIRPENFKEWSLGARFYPVLYLLTRVHQARDFGTGLPLSVKLLGAGSRLHIHHIFPKARLYEHGYTKSQVNSIANFAFLTQDTNLQISAKLPKDYLAEIADKQPGALESQWVPMDRGLWELDRYEDFLAARRELLAATANEFLESLLATPETAALAGATTVAELPGDPSPPREPFGDLEDGAGGLRDYVALLRRSGGPSPELQVEITDPLSGAAVTIADLAWRDGVQQELSEPVVLLLEADRATEHAVQALGYRVFTELDRLKAHVAVHLAVAVE